MDKKHELAIVTHTPGPWVCISDHPNAATAASMVTIIPAAHLDSERWLRTEIVDVYSCDLAHRRANAHLIAAAPEMLEALEEIECLLAYQQEGEETSFNDESLAWHRDKAAKAIEKAKGGSNV